MFRCVIEWLGARLSWVNFRVRYFFPSKVPEFLHVLFNLVEKHSPALFWAGLHFVSDKNEDTISKRAPWTQQSWTIACQPKKKIQENVFLLNWKAHAIIQALLKENFTPKSHLHVDQSCIKPFNCEACQDVILTQKKPLNGKESTLLAFLRNDGKPK